MAKKTIRAAAGARNGSDGGAHARFYRVLWMLQSTTDDELRSLLIAIMSDTLPAAKARTKARERGAPPSGTRFRSSHDRLLVRARMICGPRAAALDDPRLSAEFLRCLATTDIMRRVLMLRGMRDDADEAFTETDAFVSPRAASLREAEALVAAGLRVIAGHEDNGGRVQKAYRVLMDGTTTSDAGVRTRAALLGLSSIAKDYVTVGSAEFEQCIDLHRLMTLGPTDPAFLKLTDLQIRDAARDVSAGRSLAGTLSRLAMSVGALGLGEAEYDAHSAHDKINRHMPAQLRAGRAGKPVRR